MCAASADLSSSCKMTSPSEKVEIGVGEGDRKIKDSQTASEYINEQLALEADAREILPYKFDQCTYALGPLRQGLFACLTCSPPPASPAQVYTPAGVCYACSISCHSDHTLVELFTRRNFTCDCGSTRMPSTSPCNLRSDPSTGSKGVHSQEASKSNTYNQNFQNLFCGCGKEYDADTEKGTMYQCLGLGTVQTGGCGEDWWHPHCLMGLPKDWPDNPVNPGPKEIKPEAIAEEDEHPVPEGFPDGDDFHTMICYKCVESNPWIKKYAGTQGFLAPLFRDRLQSSNGQLAKPNQAEGSLPETLSEIAELPSLKRKVSDEEMERPSSPAKRLREEHVSPPTGEDTAAMATLTSNHKHEALPSSPAGTFSLLVTAGFREHLCHCPQCFPNLIPHPQLQEEEDEYEPSLSASEQSLVGGDSGTRSQGTASLLERGEAALNNMDRVRAIEGVMVYNNLKDKVKAFLKPYAESGQAVGAEDIKAYFEKLRGDDAAIKEAAGRPVADQNDEPEEKDDKRQEQGGY